MKKALWVLFLCFNVGFLFGQVTGDYRTRANGNWSESATWQVFFNGAWRLLSHTSAGSFRNIPPSSASGVITIRHTVSITNTVLAINQTIIQNGARLNILSGKTLRIEDDFANTPLQLDAGGVIGNSGTLDFQSLLSVTPCQINGYLVSDATILTSNPSLLLFNNGSTYQHSHRGGGNIPLANWAVNSRVYISGLTNSNPVPPGNLNQTFGNFLWSTPSMGTTTTFSLNGALTSVSGDLIINNTGATPREIRLDNGGPGTNLTIGGDLIIQGGILTLAQSQTAATTITIGGDLILSGGTLNMANTNSQAVDILLNQNFQKTGGTLTRGTGAGAGTIHFDGGIQTYSNNASITTAINFSVENGSTLDLGTSFLTGTGTFTLNSGGTLNVGAIDAGGAIQLGTSAGNIRVSGTRTYQTGSTIVYNGLGTQRMAAGHPPLPNTTINNNDSVYLISNVTINGALSQPAGVLVIDNYTLTLGGAYSTVTGYIGITTASNLVINGSGDFNDLVLGPVQSPVPPNEMNNLTINRAGGTVFLAYPVIVGGTFTQTTGNLSLGQPNANAVTLTLQGPVFQTAGTFLVDATSNLVIEGTGALPAVFNITGPDLGMLTMNRAAGTITLTSPLNTPELNLFNGIVNNTALITMTSNGLITRRSGGSLTQEVSAVTTYDLLYDVTANISTGGEMVSSATQLGNLTKLGAASVLLTHPIVVNATFTLTAGTFDVGVPANAITINRNLIVDGTFEAREGLVTFGGGSPQTISGLSPISFFDVALTQTVPSTLDLDLGTNVEIQNSLDINSGSTLNAGTNQLTLLSTPTRTANVNPLASGASIVGSVIVQRHLPKAVVNRQGYHHMASPVIGTTFADWDAELLPYIKPYRYNEPSTDFVQVSLASTIQNGMGYAVRIDGTGTFNFDSRGTLGQGTVNIPVTSPTADETSPQGWNLLGNPYPSAIGWDNITVPANVYDAVYTTDNFNNSGQETGGVTTFDVAYVDGVGTPAGYGGEIAQGQAFWVKALGNGNLTITESAKILPTNTQFYRKQEIPNILRITLNGEGVKDEAVVRLREGATPGFDGKYDAYKFLKGEISLATLTSDNIHAVINAFGTTECNTTIPLVVDGIKAGSYSLNFVGMESFDQGIHISLIDKAEERAINIRKQQVYAFTVSGQNADSFSSRFQISIYTDTAATVSLTQDGPILISSAEGNNQWYLNSELLEGKTENELEVVEPGIYTVKVSQGGCFATASLEVSELTMGDGINGQPSINVYPNPARDKLHIIVKSSNNNVKVTMVNATGIEVETRLLVGENEFKEGEFDLLPYANGIYNIRIVDGQKVFIKKIAKIK